MALIKRHCWTIREGSQYYISGWMLNFRCPFCQNGILVGSRRTAGLQSGGTLTFEKEWTGSAFQEEPTYTVRWSGEFQENQELGYAVKLDTNEHVEDCKIWQKPD